MNLWARTLRQLAVVAVALFFFSCEDEVSLLGFKNPNKKFHVGSVDIPLGVSTVLTFDSVITDLKPIVRLNQPPEFVDGLLVGQYQDTDFGKINAQSFLSVYPIGDAAIAESAVFDSITVQFRLNFYAYGFSGDKEQRFAIHEITGDTLSLYDNHRYYANSPAPVYSVDPLGEAAITVNSDSLYYAAISQEEPDTLLISGRLDQAYGEAVFQAFQAGFTTDEARRLFRTRFKGLAVLPGSEPGILGINVIDNIGQLSRVIVHYHTLNDAGTVADTLRRFLGFEFASFTKVEADRAGTELNGLQPYVSVEPLSSFRYVQSGAPVITKLDLSSFYSFADTVDNVMINEAELLIDNVASNPGLRPHGSFQLRLMNNNSDQFLNNRIAADRELAADYYVNININQLEYYYFAANESSGPALISYDEEDHRFSGFMTLFVQSLFNNKNDEDGVNENRLKYVSLYPSNPPTARSASRTLFRKENIKLRVVYTRANTANP